ncbi:MAG: GPW/gp25 family protein [Candidatus Thioglobus sp.]|jgi:phage baseplate assembly protein W
MPAPISLQINRRYSDLDLDMLPHPHTHDLTVRYDEAAINGSIKNIIKTKPGERVFRPTFGSTIYSVLFEPFHPTTKIALKDQIRSTIINHEPRVVLKIVNIIERQEKDGYEITIKYTPINETKIVTLEFFLERLR